MALFFGASLPAPAATTNDKEPERHLCYKAESSVDGPRYEVLRDSLSGTPCFRLDKYTGEVWVINNSFRNVYIPCEKEPSVLETADPEGRINYQLIVESATHAFLLNLNSGEMWVYTAAVLEKTPKFKLMTIRE